MKPLNKEQIETVYIQIFRQHSFPSPVVKIDDKGELYLLDCINYKWRIAEDGDMFFWRNNTAKHIFKLI